jgi:hypothetical protein
MSEQSNESLDASQWALFVPSLYLEPNVVQPTLRLQHVRHRDQLARAMPLRGNITQHSLHSRTELKRSTGHTFID